MGGSQSTSHQPTSKLELDTNREIYKLVGDNGGGELLTWLRYALDTGDHSLIDGYMDTKVRESLYNHGRGRMFNIAELVKIRNKDRNKRLNILQRKKSKGKKGPNVLDDFDQEGENMFGGDLKKALKILDGTCKDRTESKYRKLLWELDNRGSMGETLVGLCLLQSSPLHNQLVHKILEHYPKLVNDVCISEEYYGLSPLHQAILNKDVDMVYALLQKGADVNARCFGAHFCAEDQKASRIDSLEHEYVEISMKTNYTGNMYFGEYPLSFAVCMNQPDCYRLLLAYKANPNAQDTNGNTVLHLAVIHENWDMFELAVETEANLKLANRQKLTPLALADKMGKGEIYDQILEIEDSYVYSYGKSPLTKHPSLQKCSSNSSKKSARRNRSLMLRGLFRNFRRNRSLQYSIP